jgi:hypothetical protein
MSQEHRIPFSEYQHSLDISYITDNRVNDKRIDYAGKLQTISKNIQS